MARFKLAFGIHNHQPVGNFEAVFEEAHQQAYSPFIDLLEQSECMNISLHQSGILWKWQQSRHSEYFEKVGKLVDAGRIELMTGGFYEPILISIPERDAIGQINMLNEFIKKHFETAPTGLWLTERIWEPHLPKLLANAGVDYLPVDDTHFLYAGFEPNQLTGPFVTEHEGRTVKLLPISKRLRYLIPFGTVDEVIAELKMMAEKNPDGLAIYADDGEKFGVWPDTHKHCYTDKWLPNLIDAFEKNSDWLEIVPLSKAAETKAVGRAYIPSASYQEMLHWALPTKSFLEYEEFEKQLKENKQIERFGRFVRGGHWRGFLTKYEEVNLMHKKMLHLSERLNKFEIDNPKKKQLTNNVRDSLYASQCNCPYWHGVFGGLYLPHIRQAVLQKMVAGDSELNRLDGIKATTIKSHDFDSDGQNEILLSNNHLSAMFKPSTGASLIDLSCSEPAAAIIDTMNRRTEGYHSKLSLANNSDADDTASIHDRVVAKESNLADFLTEDWYLKRCFIDHFISEDTTLKDFARARFVDEGDFTVEPYEFIKGPDGKSASFKRDGLIMHKGAKVRMRVEKSFFLEDDSNLLSVSYRVSQLDGDPIEVIFAVENNFNFQAGHAIDRYVLVNNEPTTDPYLDSLASHANVQTVGAVDDYRGLAISIGADIKFELWRTPIFTVSLSEGGFERVYQGTSLLHRFRTRLLPEPLEFRMTFAAGQSDKVNAQSEKQLSGSV